MASPLHKKIIADALLALASTIDAVNADGYGNEGEDAAELLDPADAINLREAAAILETAVVTPSLRDYFAAKAMAAILATPNSLQVLSSQEGSPTFRLAVTAYSFADAMLAAREKATAPFTAPGRCPQHGTDLVEELPESPGKFFCFLCRSRGGR
jgi:hypothetical protein